MNAHTWMCSRYYNGTDRMPASRVTHANESHHTHEWVVSHMFMTHGTHLGTNANGSRHTYEWVTWHIWMCHCIHMNESFHKYEHTWMNRVTHAHTSHEQTYTNESFHKDEHTWMNRVTLSNTSHEHKVCTKKCLVTFTGRDKNNTHKLPRAGAAVF